MIHPKAGSLKRLLKWMNLRLCSQTEPREDSLELEARAKQKRHHCHSKREEGRRKSMGTPTPKPDVADARANCLAELTWGRYWISNLEGSQIPTASQGDLLGDLYQASDELSTRILNSYWNQTETRHSTAHSLNVILPWCQSQTKHLKNIKLKINTSYTLNKKAWIRDQQTNTVPSNERCVPWSEGIYPQNARLGSYFR